MRLLQSLASNGALAGHRSRASWPVTVVACLPVSLPSFLISLSFQIPTRGYTKRNIRVSMREGRHFAFLCTRTSSPGLYEGYYAFRIFHRPLAFCHVYGPRQDLPCSISTQNSCNFAVCSTFFSLRRRANRSRSKDVPR